MNASCTWSGHAFPWSSDLLELERARQFGHPGSPFTQSADGTDDELLEAYADAEATLEKGPYLPYREILADGLRAIAARLGTTVTDGQAAAFGGSVADWPAFRHPASAGSLAVGSWLRRGPGPTPVAQGIQLKEPPEETGSADILGANIAQLKALFSTDGLGITPGNPPVWAQGVVAGFDVR